MIQSAVYLGYVVLNSSYFCRLSYEVFVKLSKPHFFHFFLHGAGHEIQISYLCQRCIYNICILSYIYGSYSPELGEDIESFCAVQDFCLVTVYMDPQPGCICSSVLCWAQWIHQSASCQNFFIPHFLEIIP